MNLFVFGNTRVSSVNPGKGEESGRSRAPPYLKNALAYRIAGTPWGAGENLREGVDPGESGDLKLTP